MAMVLPRLDRGFDVLPALREAVAVKPSAQARKFFYDTLVFDPPTLRFLIDRLGVTQLCLGTDRPFALQEEDPVGAVEALGLSAADTALLLSANAARFIGR